MLEKSIVFGFYEKMKILGYNDFISGLVGGFISTIIVTPIDRLKINYQNKTSIKITNLYKGFTPTIFRETPGFGIYFSTYNYLNKNYNSNNYLWNNFIFGSISGLTSWIFIYPSDLIKTKYQSSNNISLINVIKNIYYNKNKGFINFYNGFNLAIMRAMPLHGGVFLGYEMAKKYFITPF
jgi:solute carrier family 25 carnitine/acylcarnitine transporter 20/29